MYISQHTTFIQQTNTEHLTQLLQLE